MEAMLKYVKDAMLLRTGAIKESNLPPLMEVFRIIIIHRWFCMQVI